MALSSDGEGVSFITLGPDTLKEIICIGEDERTKDTFPSFGMKSYFLLSPNTVPQAYPLDGFQQATKLFYTLKRHSRKPLFGRKPFLSRFSFYRLVIGCHGQKELQVAGCSRSRLASVKETQSLKYFSSESLSYPVVSTAGSNQQS